MSVGKRSGDVINTLMEVVYWERNNEVQLSPSTQRLTCASCRTVLVVSSKIPSRCLSGLLSLTMSCSLSVSQTNLDATVVVHVMGDHKHNIQLQFTFQALTGQNITSFFTDKGGHTA